MSSRIKSPLNHHKIPLKKTHKITMSSRKKPMKSPFLSRLPGSAQIIAAASFEPGAPAQFRPPPSETQFSHAGSLP